MYSLVVENKQVLNKKPCCVLKLQMFSSKTYSYMFYSKLMPRVCLKRTYNIKHPLEGNAKIVSN